MEREVYASVDANFPTATRLGAHVQRAPILKDEWKREVEFLLQDNADPHSSVRGDLEHADMSFFVPVDIFFDENARSPVSLDNEWVRKKCSVGRFQLNSTPESRARPISLDVTDAPPFLEPERASNAAANGSANPLQNIIRKLTNPRI